MGVQLNKPVILDAAQTVLQEYGLADLTMRRLAASLSVAPGALYWHFPNKQALLGGVAQVMMEQVPSVTAGVTGAAGAANAAGVAGAEEYCAALLTAITSVRDGAEIMVAALASETMDRDVVAELAHLCEGGHHQAQALVRFVLGSAWDLQTRQTVRERLNPAEEADPAGDADDSTDRHEVLAGVRAIVAGWSS